MFIILTHFFFHPIIDILFVIFKWKFRWLFIVTINTWLIFLVKFQRLPLFFRIYICICILSWLLTGLLIWLYLLILRCFKISCINIGILDFLINCWILFLFFWDFVVIIKFLIFQNLLWKFLFFLNLGIYCGQISYSLSYRA